MSVCGCTYPGLGEGSGRVREVSWGHLFVVWLGPSREQGQEQLKRWSWELRSRDVEDQGQGQRTKGDTDQVSVLLGIRSSCVPCMFVPKLFLSGAVMEEG